MKSSNIVLAILLAASAAVHAEEKNIATDIWDRAVKIPQDEARRAVNGEIRGATDARVGNDPFGRTIGREVRDFGRYFEIGSDGTMRGKKQFCGKQRSPNRAARDFSFGEIVTDAANDTAEQAQRQVERDIDRQVDGAMGDYQRAVRCQVNPNLAACRTTTPARPTTPRNDNSSTTNDEPVKGSTGGTRSPDYDPRTHIGEPQGRTQSATTVKYPLPSTSGQPQQKRLPPPPPIK